MTAPRMLGRYAIFDAIGGGGMARVYLGRMTGAAGFSRVVAIKRIHPHNANDPDYATMLLDEARLAARIRHPNVVPVLDVVVVESELLLVMEYVQGAPLSHLWRQATSAGAPIPLPIAARIVLDVLAGLHAAHEARSEKGRPLGLVHRDVSPQNIIVGDDGVARLVDFGIAKAEGKLGMTRKGEIKGKLPYMAPEQIRGVDPLDRRVDIHATGIVLWEMLTAKRLVDAEPTNLREAIEARLSSPAMPPSLHAPVPEDVEGIVMTALSVDPDERFSTADAMAHALEQSCAPARAKDVAAWVAATARPFLESQAALVAGVEAASAVHRASDDAVSAASPIENERTVTVTEPERPSREEELAGQERLSPLPPTPMTKRSRGSAIAITLFAASAMVLLWSSLRRPDEPAAPANVPNASATAVASTPHTATTEDPKASPPALTTLTSAAAPDVVKPPVSPSLTAKRPAAKIVRPAPDCEPPYSIDEHGIRIPRRECLEPSRSMGR